MALVLAPIGLLVAGAGYVYSAAKLASAVRHNTREVLSTGEQSVLNAGSRLPLAVGAVVWAGTYALGARTFRPLAARLPVPERVETAVQFVHSIMPALVLHGTACTSGVVAGAAGAAAADVALAHR